MTTTRARLLHQFGADFRFEFHRQVEGLKVVVAIPLRLEGSERSKTLRQTQQSEATRSGLGLPPSLKARVGPPLTRFMP